MHQRIRRSAEALIYALAALAISCVHNTGSLPVRNEEGPIPPHIANRQVSAKTRVGTFSPWIADGKPGIFTPTEDFATGEIYGLVHGHGFMVGNNRIIVEQWLVMRDSVSAPYNGVTLTRFPEFLPLVDKVVVHRDKLVWGFGRYPYGNPAPGMGSQEFYEWAVTALAPRQNSVAYGLGLATILKGIPPDHLDAGVGTRAVDLDTEGYVETFIVTNGCRLTVFADAQLSPFTNTTQEPFLDRFERSRRLIQAYDSENCSNLYGTGATPSTATTHDSPRTTYGMWLDAIKAWNDAEVSYADGAVFLDDDFKGEPVSLKDVGKNIAPLFISKS